MNLSKFLVRYYGVRDKEILNLTHADVKILFPQIKRSSFDYIKQHPEECATGKIVMVKDCKGNTMPYYANQIVKDLDDSVIECCKREKEVIDFNDVNLKELSNWELIKHLRRCKRSLSFARAAYKEMAIRGMKDKQREKVKRMVYNEY